MDGMSQLQKAEPEEFYVKRNAKFQGTQNKIFWS